MNRDDPTIVPLGAIGARLAARMVESLGVPTATSFREIDVARLDAERSRINAALAPRKLSFTHLLAYAVAQALAVQPEMAASYRDIDGRPHRVTPARIGLGLAVDVEEADGGRVLIAPVIAGAADLDFGEFVASYDDLVERARTGRLKLDDLAGGTVILTNPGTLGTTASVPRLLAGQGTIVATGAIRRVAGEQRMTVTSTYDHRVIQGAQSGLFLRTIDELLQGADGFYEFVALSLGAGESEHPVSGSPDRSPAATAATSAEVAAAMALVSSFRTVGHRAARLDPLGADPPGDPSLDPAGWGLTEDAMARIPASVLQVSVEGEHLADVVPKLQATYCRTIAFEVEHVSAHDERSWLRQAIESGEHRAQLGDEQRRSLLARLTAVEALERFLHRAYLGQTRFSIEGLDVLVPMLDRLIELVAASGARIVEIGMAHRGRLNVLAHTVGMPYAEILAEFEASQSTGGSEVPAEGETSDVKYHRGASGTYGAAAGPVTITVAPNPSHLEAIGPVVAGRARAAQTDRTGPVHGRDTTLAVPVVIHGDASFAAQGVVAETFNLARLAGYSTGGTVHLIANNQLGFTVEPRDGRSTHYASDLAKGFDVPIVHVNADDPEACLDAVGLALAYRDRFHADFVIDVVGYRRYGHNEGDEPAYTQPLLYERIADHPTVRQRYLRRLADEGAIDEVAAEEELALAERHLAEIAASLETAEGRQPAGAAGSPSEGARASARSSGPGTGPARRVPPAVRDQAPRTAVAARRLRAINEGLLTVPPGFTLHPKLARQVDRRRAALDEGARIEWAQAEALAFGSLLLEGTPIRLTGQDTVRGTFSQRHLVLHDVRDGRRYAPIEHLTDAKAPIELHDSPLSEFACLGFEYGCGVAANDTLVLWEAQYGDFANEAQVIIDQFILAGLTKWAESSRLTLLLPHGYEGQGPEHSSARLERFLAIGADDNIRVANCTTPGQYFHLLRDQARRDVPRPLVVMTPKGLLRLPRASSTLEDLTRGQFRAVVDDPDRRGHVGAVRRLVLCSGRIYYDLVMSERWRELRDVAVVRLEQLYPFPAAELRRLLARYPKLERVVWSQEEPRNMGARKFVVPELREIVPSAVPIVEVSRDERSSPAEGSPPVHRVEQARIVEASLVG